MKTTAVLLPGLCPLFLLAPGLASFSSQPISLPDPHAGTAFPAGAVQPRWSKDCATAAPGCTCAEITMSRANWTVAGLAFAATAAPDPAARAALRSSGPAEPPEARIRFNLTNLAAGYEVACEATDGSGGGAARRASDRDRGGVFRCDDAPRKRPGRATFRFDRLTRRLAVNQTWMCGGPGGDGMLWVPRSLSWPVFGPLASGLTPPSAEFVARGSAEIPDGCDAAVWTDDKTEAKRKECEGGSFVIPWDEIQGMA